MAVDVLKKTIVEKLPDDLEALETSMLRLQNMIDTVFKYVEDVVVSVQFISVFSLSMDIHIRTYWRIFQSLGGPDTSRQCSGKVSCGYISLHTKDFSRCL